jgi:hypothetical protein
MQTLNLAVLVTSPLDQFEITLESIAGVELDEKRLDAPCSVSVSPSSYLEPLKTIFDGRLMCGHIPYDKDAGALVVTINTLSAFLHEQELESLWSPQFTEYQKLDNAPQSKEAEMAAIAKADIEKGLVY